MKSLLSVFAIAIAVTLSAGSSSAASCVDVEKASAKELTTLKGVGAATAKSIIDYRKAERTKATKAKKKTWNFKNWKTLLKVSGVGPKICTDNVANVCFSGKVQKACPKK